MKKFLNWRDLLTTALIAGSAICLLAIGLETDWGHRLSREMPLPPAKPPGQPIAPSLPVFQLGALDQSLPESLNRPLFVPTRRPVPQAAPQAAMKRGQFQLVGTNRSSEFGHSAMLKDVASNKTSIIKEGGTIQDMTLKRIEADRVVLQLGEETEELVMKAKPMPRAPGQLGPGAGAGAAASGQAAAGSNIFGGPTATAAPGVGPGQAGAMPVPPAMANPGPGPSGAVAPAFVSPRSNSPAPGQEAGERRPTPEEILERRRRARAQQAQ